MLIAGFFPWSIFAIPVIVETARRLLGKDAWQPGYLLAVCWIAVYLGTFSIARTQLANYITPCYPAAALLVGAFIDRWLADKLLVARWWPAFSFAVLGLVGGGMIAGGYFVADKFLPGEQYLGFIGLLPLLAGILALGRHLLQLDRRWTAGILTAAFIPMTTLIFAFGAQRVDAHRHDQQLLAGVLAGGAKPKLASFRILEPSWVYYAKQPIEELPMREPQPRGLLPLTTTKQTTLVARMNANKQAVQYFAKHADGYLITTREQLAELQPHLPPEVTVVAEQPLFLKGKKLVLIGRPPASILAKTPDAKPQR
jgi:hypothetical protein